jgi:glutamate dehydrogenase/leucine dehydrogenase
LIKAPTQAIEMTPVPGSGILLSELNQIIAEQRGVAVDDLSLKENMDKKLDNKKETATVTETPAIVQADVTVSQPASFESPEAEAKWYRSQADKLAKEAANFRRKAEELAPTKKKV